MKKNPFFLLVTAIIAMVGLVIFLAAPVAYAQRPEEKQGDVSRLNMLSFFQVLSLLEDAAQVRQSSAGVKRFYDCMLRRAFRVTPRCFGDRHAAYFSPHEAVLVKERGHFAFVGVGVDFLVAADVPGVVVTYVSAVQADILRVGDIIIAVAEEGQKDATFLAGISSEVAGALLRGPVGSSLTLHIVREGNATQVSVTRKKDAAPTITFRELKDGIVYAKILSFSPTEIEQLEADLLKQKEKKTRLLVVDLRDNGDDNGDDNVRAALRLVSWFAPLPRTLFAEKRYQEGAHNWTVMMWQSSRRGFLADMKTVVLTNSRTEGSAELVAGDLKFWGATVVGERTRGEAGRRERFDLADGSVLQLTTHLYFIANGTTHDTSGVAPSGMRVVDDPKTPQDEVLDVATALLLSFPNGKEPAKPLQ